MGLVHSALGKNRGPTTSDFDSVVADSQESKNAHCHKIDDRSQFVKFFAFMERLFRLPPMAGPEDWQVVP